MEITDVTATKISNESWGEFIEFPLTTIMSKYEEYRNINGENPQARRKWMGPVGDVVVQVETDAGTTGVGVGNWGTGAIATIVEETLSKIVMGKDPVQRELLWEQMYRATLPFGRKGAAVMAISAVDQALWDIAGKEAGKPVYELLGGPTKSEIPAYASNLHPVDMETLEREAQEYAEAGFDTMKMRFLHGPEAGRAGMAKNEEIVKTVRDAVGDEIEIAADAYMGWSVGYAKKMLDRLEPYDMAWVEEPVIADDISGYAEVREAAPMPISGGEHEFTRWGHEDLLEAGAVDILQPDVGRVGGITEMMKVADMAEVHDVPVIPHAGTNPTLHAIAAHTNMPMAEYFPTPEWFQEQQQEQDSTYADAIFENPPSPENGAIPIPEDAGVSTQLNREALEHFAVE
ncbi:L-rhamnonate dehydratase [Natronolimnobius sp. AArcel1]|uniref:L-rhamnonate dehydratase n=1 Tax=Natronolimnobius sp. AArcel1 TaxID=1679093 RepID=UPI0013EA8D71|nr:L-rhamnonate dehydratase [Natronolimnobius sp. AArcel1]NGM67748.1 L-rhamnonate dehydratase [Natronolimnobius sp. AArcel1]